MYDLVVIGAGAAGMMAAGRAGERGKKVLLLEKMDRPGRKIFITGKGRCNVSNTASKSDFIKRVYPNGRFLKHAFNSFYYQDIVDLLDKLGVKTTIERGGRIFPTSNKSGDIVNAMLKYTKQQGVELRTHKSVKRIIANNGCIEEVLYVNNGSEETVKCKAVIICSGGKSYPATGSTGDGYSLLKELGHSVTDIKPALVPLEVKNPIMNELSGLALKNVNASLWIDGKKARDEFGEMLFSHFGLTGPIILTLSRTAVEAMDNNCNVEVVIDLKPALDDQKLDNRLMRDLDEHGKKKMANIMKFWVPSSLINPMLHLANVDMETEGHQLTGKQRKKIRHQLKNLAFTVSGYRSFNEAIITAGGIPTTEIEAKTMRSKLVSNLYFAGEIIDVDAETGGYNLQIAWSTGWLAGSSV